MDLLQLQNSVSTMRKELKNLRKQVDSLKHMLKSELLSIRRMVSHDTQNPAPSVSETPVLPSNKTPGSETSLASILSTAAIGVARTCFREKNGTPRQPGLCPNATGYIELDTFTNPNHALDGLEDYSHAWAYLSQHRLIFVFHHNGKDSVKSKVKPPRLVGEKKGVLATRSPHRPCPVGLSLVRVDRVTSNTVYVSGIDVIDGTPILDIKPYIPTYDDPTMHLEAGVSGEGGSWTEATNSVRVASWLDSPSIAHLDVEFTTNAEQQLSLFQCQPHPSLHTGNHIESHAQGDSNAGNKTDTTHEKSPYLLQTFSSICDARQAIVSILRQDPRSVYRRDKCSQELYKFSIDNLNITCQFIGTTVIITDIQPKAVWKYS